MIKAYKGQFCDMPHITRLDIQTQEFALDVDGVKQYFTVTNKASYVAQLGGREVGFALVTCNESKGTVFIDRIGAHPSFRRVGVGRKIVERIATEAATKKIDKIQTIVPSYVVDDMEDPWNIEQWLWKLGFKAVKTISDHFHRYNRDYDGYIFERMKP
jgi:ribosomal protein S18 acetylase RimI-like enzyme